MPLRISLATTPKQIDAALRLRHQVFAEEESLFTENKTKRMIDRFDAYPTTKNFIVTSGRKVVGTMRITLDSPMGVPADEYYDFRQHLPQGARILNSGMYGVLRAHRGGSVAMSLLEMASYFAVEHNVTHVVAPINPHIARMVGKMGGKLVDEEQSVPGTGLKFIPIVLDMAELDDFMIAFSKQNKLHNFMKSFDCMHFKAGEQIIKKGADGDEAYVVIDGKAEVVLPRSKNHILEEGDVFGELALLTQGYRSADVLAKTNLRLMCLPKRAFMAFLKKNPERALAFLRNLGVRLQTVSEG